MQRKTFLRNSGLGLAALAFLHQPSFGWPMAGADWNIKMLTPTIGVFTERGGSIVFLLSREGIVVVDSQFPEQAQHLVEELKKKSAQPFRLLINTHHHGDHSAGNIAFKGMVADVVAHENSKLNQEKVAREKKNEDQQLYPNKTFTSTWRETVGEEEIALYYFGPAHTNGDCFVHFTKANIVHAGDLVANRRHPFVDRSAGANMQNWLKVVDKGISTFDKNTRFVCGHAGAGYDVVASLEDVKLFNDYLDKTIRFVENALKAGKSKEEILSTTLIPGAEQWKGDGLSRPLLAAYEELTLR